MITVKPYAFTPGLRATEPTVGPRRAFALIAVLPPLLFHSGFARSQQLPPAVTNRSRTKASRGVLQEVVVTASKQQETVLHAALSVSTLSPEQLQQAGVVGLQNLTSTVPGVQMKSVGLANSIQVAMRGISNDDFNEPGNPAIATYVDGVYVGRTEGLAGALYDIERIEIVRGPQGTLYGRNSTGGNINIVTPDPAAQLSAALSASYGNYNDVQIQGMVNLPVATDLAVRIAFTTHRNDGYYDTLRSSNRNYGAANDYGGRVTALWSPAVNFNWRLAVDDFVMDGTPNLDIETAPNGQPQDGLPVFRRPVRGGPDPFDHLKNLMVRSRINWSIGDGISLSYIAGYQNLNSTVQFVTAANSFHGLRPDWTNSDSHEIDLHYDSHRVRNILGASYFKQTVRSADSYDFYTIGYTASWDLTFPTASSPIYSPLTVPNTAWGVFDQATVSLSDNLRVTGGLRYSDEGQTEKALNFTLCPLSQYESVPLPSVRTLYGPGCVTSPQGTTSGAWSDLTWKAGISYDLSDRTASYLTVSTGFKSGGISAGISVAPTFRPEKVTSYELGLKARILDHHLSINSAVFYARYSDLQVSQIVDAQTVTENAAQATAFGPEIEAECELTSADTLAGFFDYLHATYGAYGNAVDGRTGLIYPSLKGNDLPFSPHIAARLRYSHDFSLSGGGTIKLMAAAYWQSSSYLRSFNFPIDYVPSYSKTDLNLSYTNPNGDWNVSAFVYNAENRAVRNMGFTVLGTYFSDYNAPRTFGVRVGYDY